MTHETPEEKLERRKDGITIKLPGGTEVKLGGYNVFVTIILIIVSVLAFLLWDHREVSAATLAKVAEAQLEHKEILTEMIYVLSLDQRKRDELNISMPPSLKKKIRQKERRERDDPYGR